MTTSDELGGFCHDHYQHPLLWCEDKKRLMERKNAEESLRMWRRRKAEEMARKEKDKEEYYELFLKHCPWGRPGGGAPNLDIRRKDITAVGLHSTPTISTMHRLTSLPPCRYSDYFSQRKKCHDPAALYHHHHHHHNHPPPRVTTHTHTVQTTTVGADTAAAAAAAASGALSSSGDGVGKNGESLHITLKDHPSMSFRNKGHLDIEVRYKPTAAAGKGKPMLEKIVVTESEKCPLAQSMQPQVAEKVLSQKKKLASKLEKPPSKEPWGKAGPGGKPWRSPKAAGSTFMKSLGWTNKELLKDLDQDNPATPAEKPTFRKVRTTKKVQRCCDLCICTCPSMVTSTLRPLQKKPHQSLPNKGQHGAKLDTATTKQKTCPRFVRHCVGGGGGGGGAVDATENSADVASGGGVELVPLLARRRANNRPISLSSTDVTKRTASNDRLSTAQDLRYLHDLNTQMSEKRRSFCEAQQLDRELCNRHFETFDTYWGRPGHGAPSEIKNKLKLDNLLYGVADCWE